jgi:hypothetical protein
VEGAVAAPEGGVGEEAAPGLADEGGAREERGVVRRDAEEDLHDEIGHQLRRRARRRHGALVGSGAQRGFGLGEKSVWLGFGLGDGEICYYNSPNNALYYYRTPNVDIVIIGF